MGLVLSLRSRSLEHRRVLLAELLADSNISGAQERAFLRLVPHLRPVAGLTRHEVLLAVLRRIRHRVIRSAVDLDRLAAIFRRFDQNEQEIVQFVRDPDMTVSYLLRGCVVPRRRR